jgi:NADH-quinone oxidoreductase subunit N
MLVPLLPLLLPSGMAVVATVVIAFRRSHTLSAALALAGLAAGLVAIPLTARAEPRRITALLLLDGWALLLLALVLGATFVVVLLAHGYLQRRGGRREELYVLLVLAAVGAGVLVASTHVASFFLGLEILSVSLYALLAYDRTSPRGLEAGLKYLVLAASSAAFLLLGLAFLYADTGTMDLAPLSRALSAASLDPLVLVGLVLALVGIGFKLAVVPFHLWTADVYEGAPAPVTAFLATVSKGAMLALLLRWFVDVQATAFRIAVTAIAIASMLIGNLLAVRQENVKRLLAYSSIAHLGYLLVAFLAGGRFAAAAVGFYLAAYFATTLAAFGVVGARSGGERDADALDDYRGLAWRQPGLASVLTIALLSLAGIPLTAGFVGKFYVLEAGAGAALWAALLVLVAGSAVGLYYYLRVVVVLFQRSETAAARRTAAPTGVVLAFLLAAILWLGFFPARLAGIVSSAAGGLGR